MVETKIEEAGITLQLTDERENEAELYAYTLNAFTEHSQNSAFTLKGDDLKMMLYRMQLLIEAFAP